MADWNHMSLQLEDWWVEYGYVWLEKDALMDSANSVK